MCVFVFECCFYQLLLVTTFALSIYSFCSFQLVPKVYSLLRVCSYILSLYFPLSICFIHFTPLLIVVYALSLSTSHTHTHSHRHTCMLAHTHTTQFCCMHSMPTTLIIFSLLCSRCRHNRWAA
uniref:Uncharacterized protein n=1 Tax=Anopheles triannulatus TaxID=58253 RepID=A0A2M4AW76_9DIPT